MGPLIDKPNVARVDNDGPGRAVNAGANCGRPRRARSPTARWRKGRSFRPAAARGRRHSLPGRAAGNLRPRPHQPAVLRRDRKPVALGQRQRIRPVRQLSGRETWTARCGSRRRWRRAASSSTIGPRSTTAPRRADSSNPDLGRLNGAAAHRGLHRIQTCRAEARSVRQSTSGFGERRPTGRIGKTASCAVRIPLNLHLWTARAIARTCSLGRSDEAAALDCWNRSILASPQAERDRRIGMNVRPRSDKLYSTLGGT